LKELGFSQFFSHRNSRVTHFIHRPLQLFFADVQVLGPVANLVLLSHRNLGTVGNTYFG
jgi:hypothetical protein